ncbi:MAG: TonB-dependent receptor plug domain-containing protein, partial [Bacteroidota bacterium]
MRSILTSWLILVVLSVSLINEVLCQISGSIINQDRQPIPLALVSIDNSYSALSDEHGRFVFDKGPIDGAYTVNASFIGHKDASVDIEIINGEVAPSRIELVLEEEGFLMDKVEIIGDRYEVTNNEAQVTTISKLPVEQRHQIQSIALLNQQMLSEQQIRSLDEAVNLAPGFNLEETRGGTMVNIQVRGYRSSMMYNGLRLEPNSRGGQGLFNFNLLDNVEFISGSTGIGLGNASAGGTVNVNSKQAKYNNSFNAFVSYGSWDTKSVNIDKNVILHQDKLAFRINGAYVDGRRARVHTDYRNVGVAPSLLFTPSKKTRIRLDYV